ncbi:MAG: helix-turn-helix domain-containing protein [Bacteroidales bacterium]|nr:helix-turn-helix domain-containing protein [Bacteroidales bacterium]
MQKEFIMMLAVATVMAGCVSRQSTQMVALGADSTYTYKQLTSHFTKDPRYTLKQVDTAEMKGIIGRDSCNMLRGYLYYYLDEYEPSREFLRKVLDNPRVSHTSPLYLETLDYYCALCMKAEDYAECMQNAIEGTGLAKEIGSARFEAAFYNKAGHAMEEERPGSGIDYMTQAVDIARHQPDKHLLPKASYYMSNLSDVLIEQGRLEEAVELNRQRLELVDEMEKEGLYIADGYFDSQRGACYCWLAVCLQELGHAKEAREAAERFEKTPYASTPSGMHGILHYYVMTGNRERVTQLCRTWKDYFRERGETVSEIYRTVLLQEAEFHRLKGEYRQADSVGMLAAEMKDSLIANDLNEQAVMYETKYKMQEMRMEMNEKEAQARFRLFLVFGLAVILSIIAVALWRLLVDRRQINEKNRALFETVEQMQREKDEQRNHWMKIEATREEMQSEEPSVQLFRRICTLMDEQQPYTDGNLKREDLARLLGTNYNYVAAAIRNSADGATVGEFLDEYRLRHAARLLASTDESIGIIADMSGFQSRSKFNTLFRDRFKLTPSEFRKAAKSEHP